MEDTEADRVEGVDFTDVGPLLEEIPYPITTEELVAEYGDRSIQRTNAGPITIRELFEPMGEDTSNSVDELRQSILTLMPKDSVGRQRYSDRGLTIDEEEEAVRKDRPLPGHDTGKERP
jgi:hypothetical protein